MIRLALVVVLTAAAWCPAAAARQPAWSHVELRGTQQDVLRLPGAAPHKAATVLFLPGDGGWRGAARQMASSMAGSGYDVIVWDTKRYLTSFTSSRTGGLSTDRLGLDFRAMRTAVSPDGARPVILIGWSQGAAKCAAAASEEGKSAFAGTILLALPDAGLLAWRWRDNLTYLTGRTPNEPMFQTEPFLSHLTPLPVAVIQAGRDRFTPASVSHRLVGRLRHPRHIRTLEDAEHDFGPDRSAMYRELRTALHWLESKATHRASASARVP